MKRHLILAAVLALATLSAQAGEAYAGGSSRSRTQLQIPGATQAIGGGSGNAKGAKPGEGFGCEKGNWDFQAGVLTCADPGPGTVEAFDGKTLKIRVPSGDGWVSSPVAMLVGGRLDIRLDALAQTGASKKSCYVYSAGQICSVAYLTGSANEKYGDKLPAGTPGGNGGDGQMLTAIEFLKGQSKLGGSDVGAVNGDNYIVSVEIGTDGRITVYIAGFFTNADTHASGRLTPRFATASYSATELKNLQTSTVVEANSWVAPR